LVVPNDGPYGKVRLWYKQFYNPRDQAPDAHKRTNGLYVTLDKRKSSAAA
jgi:3-ketosteroid 9alpha-monooxygenase subunit A